MTKFEVIGTYPGSKFTIGQIIVLDKETDAGKKWHSYTDAEPVHLEADTDKKFPAIYKRIWPEVDISELVETPEDNILVANGDMFDGSRDAFRDNFFDNANNDQILGWCVQHDWSLEINGLKIR